MTAMRSLLPYEKCYCSLRVKRTERADVIDGDPSIIDRLRRVEPLLRRWANADLQIEGKQIRSVNRYVFDTHTWPYEKHTYAVIWEVGPR